MTDSQTIDQGALDLALQQFQSARQYTKGMLAELQPEHWFWTPQPPISHIAWQIGHLAVAQYGLMLFRQRGRRSEDSELMASDFRKLFMKGTTPATSAQDYPRPEEIVAVLEGVHLQVMKEAAEWRPEELSAPTEPPHAGHPNRLGSLMFAAHHEMLHSGQIGMLRRLMGLLPIR